MIIRVCLKINFSPEFRHEKYNIIIIIIIIIIVLLSHQIIKKNEKLIHVS